MAVRLWRAAVALLVLTAGCATHAPQVKRVVLLAPFESTYREVGYDALYPVKLALAEEALPGVQLLSADDGSSVDRAILRAQALSADPTITLALLAGPIATDKAVLDALQDIPIIVIGEWAVEPEQGVFVLASEEISTLVTSRVTSVYDAAALSEATGGEIFGLKSFAALSRDGGDITVLTSAIQPSAEFRGRLLGSDLYVPEPGLLATLAYDAGTLTARVIANSSSREDVLTALRTLEITGINGSIAFNDFGYWADAPMYKYRYSNGVLTMVTD